ncbi:MAG: hypothetical protein KA715_14495 [Xanthomonadaceae bacterium]|nr:hypothetical protein [Xanthomonadaceae bacterium]
MMFFELYPLTISELDQRPLPDFFIIALSTHTFQKGIFEDLSISELRKRVKSVQLYLEKGGLPGICFLREERLRQERLNDLHRLMLDRDLRLVHKTKISSVFIGIDFLILRIPINGSSKRSVGGIFTE